MLSSTGSASALYRRLVRVLILLLRYSSQHLLCTFPLHLFTPALPQITAMKFFVALAAFVVTTAAQRLSILEPTTSTTVTSGSPFTVELHEDVSCLFHSDAKSSTLTHLSANFV